MIKRAAVSYLDREDGRILCVWNPRYGGWTMPGGLVEDGETLADAQRRELREETSLQTLDAFEFYNSPAPASSIPGRGSDIHVFLVRATGTPRETEAGCPVTWLTREEFLKWSPFAAFYEKMFDAWPPTNVTHCIETFPATINLVGAWAEPELPEPAPRRQTLREQVTEFHRAIDHPVRDVPAIPADSEVRSRCLFVIEEAFEFLEACIASPIALEKLKRRAKDEIMISPVEVQFGDAMDALGDLDFVSEGSRLVFGVHGDEIAAEIARINLTKVSGGKDPITNKQLKPAGWKPPDIAAVLRKQGWKGEGK